MTSLSTMAQDGKATTIKKAFSRETTVSIEIAAHESIVWSLLTNAADYHRWNSTIISLEGEIVMNGRIQLKSTLDEKRTFKLKIKTFLPEYYLEWGDGRGSRIFTLEKVEGGVIFKMSEKIGGVMFPMYAKYIPPFDESFEHFASDLKREAEIIQHAK